MFRGFRAAAAPRGRVEYHFKWLLRRPLRAVFDARRDVVSFVALFPAVEKASPMAADLLALVGSRSSRDQPAHKRVDARRARISALLRRGDWSLAVHVRGKNHAYALRHALNLINELFVMLQEHYPDYLVTHFGMSTE